ICGVATGKQAPAGMQNIEKTKTSKADLKAALDASFKFCEAGFEGLTAASGAGTVKFFVPGNHTRLGALAFNNAHLFEHHDNLVSYMGLKGLVPPSSAPR